MLRLLEHALSTTVLILVALTVSQPSHADSGLLTGNLGRWLDTEVLPQLGRTLGEHPRFKGETIKLVSLAGGQPLDRSSRLHQAVQAHLTQRLLSTSGVRIAWTDQPQRSCGVTEQAVYLLGVEIERDGGSYHKLNIGMIDVAESVWISGVNHTWRGRLTSTESAALKQTVAAAPAGTVDNPLPANATSQIARAMHRHLRCAHPEGLDGPVFLEPATTQDLSRVLASLRTELATAPIAAISSSDQNAVWHLSVTASQTGTGSRVHQLDLQLTEQNNRVTQQVATVYVTGSAPDPSHHYPTTALAGITSMLTDLRLEPAANEGICDSRKVRGNQCAEISFELLEPAYLFVLSSRERALTTTACDSNLVQAASGERRFRIRVPPSRGDLPDAGVYAIAVSDRTAAKALSRHIRTGICSRPLHRSTSWLDKLGELLAEHDGSVQWRAIHLTHAPRGVERL